MKKMLNLIFSVALLTVGFVQADEDAPAVVQGLNFVDRQKVELEELFNDLNGKFELVKLSGTQVANDLQAKINEAKAVLAKFDARDAADSDTFFKRTRASVEKGAARAKTKAKEVLTSAQGYATDFGGTVKGYTWDGLNGKAKYITCALGSGAVIAIVYAIYEAAQDKKQDKNEENNNNKMTEVHIEHDQK